MSELKAISGLEIREDIEYNTRGVDLEDKEWCNYGKELCDTLYYCKSEADKVIAELKESVKNLILDNYLKDKEIRRQKYKRCLDKARWCESENYTACWYHENSERCKWTEKWQERWLELAEQYKEAK